MKITIDLPDDQRTRFESLTSWARHQCAADTGAQFTRQRFLGLFLLAALEGVQRGGLHVSINVPEDYY